jgi:Cu+-exporting ATPase
VKIQVPENFKALPGRGITCNVGDRDVAVGNRRLMEEENITLPAEVEEQVQKLECEAKT